MLTQHTWFGASYTRIFTTLSSALGSCILVTIVTLFTWTCDTTVIAPATSQLKTTKFAGQLSAVELELLKYTRLK